MAVSENNRKFAIGKQRLGIMVEINDRKLPVGIQSFEKIRKDGYLYVDKTDIIWQLAPPQNESSICHLRAFR